VTIDVAADAYLPRDYVSRDDVRMEAYRRLAAVTTEADVDDVRDEWLDRYGPLPPPAETLLDVARLRAECVRLGINTVTVARNMARLQPVTLRESQKVRLRRIAPKAVAKPDGELAVPISQSHVIEESSAAFLVGLLRELVPPAAVSPPAPGAPLASAAP